MVKTIRQTVANWGNYPSAEAEIALPQTRAEALEYVQSHPEVLARGNGKCYGDAALADHLLSTLALNRVLDFDAASGMVTCEAGVLLHDLLKIIVPAGWFFHVTPGIKNISVGGAIACDVHGKNHPAKGCFSNWLISFELLTADGQIRRCARDENPALFWQTCGGMGWTGIILSAQFRLMRLPSMHLRQTALRAANLDALFDAFEEHRTHTYAAGWVDCLSAGPAFGRGVVFLAEHAEDAGETLVFLEKKLKNVPFFAPSWILNPISIRIHNHIIFSRAKTGERLVGLDAYFYPLDRVQNWNRLYGRRGFIQYQFCLPEAQSREGVRRILETIRRSPDLPFLTVLKRHGERPAEAIHAFPIKGYSLALDFPRSRSVFDLVKKLDALVWDFGGKIYLAKDACSAPRMGRVDPRTFGEAKFHSHLKTRLLQDDDLARRDAHGE